MDNAEDTRPRNWKNYVQRKFIWNLSHAGLEVLYRCLMLRGWITCSFPEFENHFSSSLAPIIKRIIWTGMQSELVHLVGLLLSNCIIKNEKDIWLFVSHHFILSGEQEINIRSCASIKNKGASYETFTDLEKIIDEITEDQISVKKKIG